jgi:hypothetical protein
MTSNNNDYNKRMVASAIGNYNVDGLCSGLPSERMFRSHSAPKCAFQRERVSDRKYRQHGYDDSGGERQKPSPDKPVRKDTFGPRPVQMPGTHAVSRCAQCGTLLTQGPEPSSRCPKCGFELHSCKQCTYFDPSSRFECTQPVPERIAKKDARNECRFYSISVRVEKQTSTGVTTGPDAARKAFDSLFKD